MRRHWGPPQGWQRPDAEWWTPRPGHEAWQHFGKRMWIGGLLFMIFGIFFVMAVLALVVTVVVGVAKAAWYLMPVFLILGGFLVVRSAGRTWTPVRGLIEAAGSLAEGDYSARVPETGPPSVRPVATSFNQMASRLEEAEEQRRRLLADVGHELRTPLTVVRGEIEAMLDGVHQADPDHLEQLLEEVGVMERLLEDLRTMSLAEAGALTLHPEPTDIGDLVRDVVLAQRRASDEAGVVVTVAADPDPGEVVVDPVRIREVVTNLVVNAIRAMPDGGALTLEVGADQQKLSIDVRDTGTGIGDEDLDSVFERFKKGSTSSGSGLGLTISKDLVEAHGGTIAIESEPGSGTTVRVQLPLVRAQP